MIIGPMAVARQSEALMSHTLQGLSAVKHLTLDQVAVSIAALQRVLSTEEARSTAGSAKVEIMA